MNKGDDAKQTDSDLMRHPGKIRSGNCFPRGNANREIKICFNIFDPDPDEGSGWKQASDSCFCILNK
jgi:hypothetical protein